MKAFLLVSLTNPHQMVRVAKIQLGTDLGVVERGEHCAVEGQWILVSNSDFIQVPIINTRVQRTILLLDEEEPGPNWRGGPNQSRCKGLPNISLYRLTLCPRQAA